MWTLTGFADEIGPELEEQLDTLESESMKYLELRGIWNKNVLDLTDEEVERAKAEMDRRGIRVSSIGSPIGKINITDDFDAHMVRFRRALWCAERFGAPYIRIFSFWMPEGKADEYRDEVLRRMRALADAAKGHNVTLLHENEKHIYGDIPRRCLDIVESVGSPNLRIAWDPANYVQCGVTPHDEGYELLRPYIEYVHVKDALKDSGKVVVAGAGDGQVRKTIRALKESGFDGFFSLEPHLQKAEAYSGFSGAEKFVEAVRAFKRLLEEEGIAWT